MLHAQAFDREPRVAVEPEGCPEALLPPGRDVTPSRVVVPAGEGLARPEVLVDQFQSEPVLLLPRAHSRALSVSVAEDVRHDIADREDAGGCAVVPLHLHTPAFVVHVCSVRGHDLGDEA